MNPLFERLMRKATLLTQGGSLQEATRAIQRALSGGAAPPAADRPAPAPAANDDTLVVDVEARVVEPAPAPAPAPAPTPTPAPASEGGVEQWSDGLFAHQHRPLAYKLFVPAKGAGSPRPLVLMLHGCTQNPEDFAAGTQMNQLAREHGFLVLYPAQTQHANSSKCWNWFTTQHQQRGRGEPALLAALTRSVMDSQGIDPERVYVAGLSAGGAMADILGRSYPDLFAAVGVHSGLPSGAASDLMTALAAMKSGPAASRGSGPAVPTIVFHGDADSTVNARNGEALVASALAGQDGPTAPVQASGGRSPRGRDFTRRVHADAQGRPAVEHWLLHGAGHAWSGGSSSGTYTDPSGPDASAEMLRFFLSHRKAAAPAMP
ncbi:extracellular catalytic domain type 1 short-chain-length polyhydroxyalkanoate depolymerase [Variovorax saccharolyticus]|uniref:extracellular catalytic domain type 1 short-chain-length polyhydroxyalkanoate depolymerase n=1 Tax=Variovorax saccharolyticus TaxID=3053516 RepID=UPI002577F6F2|nr:PHB depolymerase family esterase [Variovorax sp. J22R187]MDM0017528.1 PHB depolymerase family esterase [Variovorax sp. J22R187]